MSIKYYAYVGNKKDEEEQPQVGEANNQSATGMQSRTEHIFKHRFFPSFFQLSMHVPCIGNPENVVQQPQGEDATGTDKGL